MDTGLHSTPEWAYAAPRITTRRASECDCAGDSGRLIPTRTERHVLAQSRRPMGMTRYSLRSENPGMSQPSRGLVLAAQHGAAGVPFKDLESGTRSRLNYLP